jgi:hypothetical protein
VYIPVTIDLEKGGKHGKTWFCSSGWGRKKETTSLCGPGWMKMGPWGESNQTFRRIKEYIISAMKPMKLEVSNRSDGSVAPMAS